MNYLGRCKKKGCDYALFATSEQINDAPNFAGVKSGQAPVRVGNNGVFGRCNGGHKFFPLKPVEGTYSDKHQCDSRCLNAKGNDCTCSCGGANHGRGYAVQIIEAAAITPVNPDAITDKQEAFIRRLLDERVLPANGEQSGEERKAVAVAKLNQNVFTKKQASATIEMLLTLPKNEA